QACAGKTLKVILETGEMDSMEQVILASDIAIASGADFVKTSTGKTPVSATPEAVTAICSSIRSSYEKTGRKTGCKASGGIATYEDALVYLDIVYNELGEEWIT